MSGLCFLVVFLVSLVVLFSLDSQWLRILTLDGYELGCSFSPGAVGVAFAALTAPEGPSTPFVAVAASVERLGSKLNLIMDYRTCTGANWS